MNKKELIKKIEAEAKKFFVGASGCHDWTHVDRVRNLALHIGKKEKANLFILEIAALLHDIGRKGEIKSKGNFCHAVFGGEMARKILPKHGLSKDEIENIIHSIQAHRHRNEHIPNTIEAKVLFDADKLDSIGAVGVARDFLFAGNAGSNNLYTGNEKSLASGKKDYSYTKEDSALLEYYIKLRFIYKKMTTNEGKKIAKERQKFMNDFFARFDKEIKGII
jgi:uncharacterized protein